ncbi:MAG: nuclear transport factor 2 family protein [Erythrobacter sp.]|jgi:ketosteroid isomerase-like protein|nr:nuclear transport factor 2 family protein [Erythrobacter sp.]
MSGNFELGEKLYTALRTGDGATLTEILHPDFRGDITPNLPFGIGGVYPSLETMMQSCWGVIGQHYEMRSEVEHFVATDDAIIGYGVYVGKAKATGKPVEARFAHFWFVENGKIVGLHQVTDGHAWREAVASA